MAKSKWNWKQMPSLSTDPYPCAIKERHSYFVGWKTVGHIPREISRYIYFFVKEENGKGFGTLNLLKYKASPIPSGGLEVPLSLKLFVQGKMGCQYHGGIHLKFVHFRI